MDFNDGVKINWNHHEWIHIRKSNTENIIRIYSESFSKKRANYLTNKMINEIKNFL